MVIGQWSGEEGGSLVDDDDDEPSASGERRCAFDAKSTTKGVKEICTEDLVAALFIESGRLYLRY